MDPTKLADRFYELGPTARLCLDYNDYEATEYEVNRRSEIGGFDNPRKLLPDVASAAAGLKMFDSYGSIGPLSHKICLIRRPKINTVSSKLVVYPMSTSVVEQLLLSLQVQDEKALLSQWRTLSNHPDGKGLGGVAFEAYVHQQFRARITIAAQRMFKGRSVFHMQSASYDGRKILKKAKDKFLKSNPGTDIEVDFRPSDCKVYVGNQFTILENVYYQPRSRQQVGIDAFFVRQDHLYLLQYTGGSSHGANDKVVAFLGTLPPLPPRPNWHFIFVIPEDTEVFSSSPDPIISSLLLYTAVIPVNLNK